MPHPSQMQDRYGLPLTTSSTRAVECFVEGLDLLLGQNFGPEEQFTQAIEADPGFALAHSALAYMFHLRAQVAEARECTRKAQALAAGISRRERSRLRPLPSCYWPGPALLCPHSRAPGRLPTGYADAQWRNALGVLAAAAPGSPVSPRRCSR